jgi:hypothetical protein
LRSPRLILAIFLFGVAPIGAVVVISALMLFGVSPQTVFTPGRVLVSTFAHAGIKVPRPLGVLATVAFFWAIIVALVFAVERLRGYPRIGA